MVERIVPSLGFRATELNSAVRAASQAFVASLNAVLTSTRFQ
jgi:hypothetical protein